ncbi:unnamed protein product [marine sediment metagenome]|uniref:Uncharacterized protein n=1 Tax=marine sediment metagenome TaxID=412755 RepID=X0TWG4_9ZZZZ
MQLSDIDNPELRKKLQDAIKKEDAIKRGDSGEVSNLELGDKHTTKGNKRKSKIRRNLVLESKEQIQEPYIQVPVIIVIRFFRKRLPDFDGCIVKWIVDCFVEARILGNDTQAEVKEVIPQYKKVKTEDEEKTVVEIYEA